MIVFGFVYGSSSLSHFDTPYVSREVTIELLTTRAALLDA